MTANPVFCLPGDPVRCAAELMAANGVGAIPIVVEPRGRHLVGIVTDRDLALRVLARGGTAETVVGLVMTSQPCVCHPDDDLDVAMQVMEAQQVRRVPIVDGDGRLTGMLAQADIARQVPHPDKVAQVVEGISQPGHREAVVALLTAAATTTSAAARREM
jgi:CBS domain-containing protein